MPTGAAKVVGLAVRPPRQIWIGRALERRFEVASATGEAGEKLLAARAQDAGGGGLRVPQGIQAPKVSAPRVDVGPAGLNFQGPQFRQPSLPQKQFDLSRPTLGLRALKRPGADAGMPAVAHRAAAADAGDLPPEGMAAVVAGDRRPASCWRSRCWCS